MRTYKIAIVSPYPPSKGTLNEYAFHLVKHLRTKEAVTELVILSDELPEGQNYSDLDDALVPSRIVNCWKFNSWLNPLRILQALRAEKPDIVLYNIQFLSFGDKKIAAALGLLSPLICKIFGMKTVVLLHNILEEVDLEKAGISNNKILNLIYNAVGTLLTRIVLKADLVAVTIGKYVDVLEEKYKAKNVILMPHGSFEIPPLPDFQLPDGPLQVMTFGKFGTYKKVEELIEAVEKVRNRTDLDIEIVIAGTDNPNVAGYLKGVAEKYKDVPQIRFTGYVEEADVPVIFHDCAVSVFPYTSTTGSSGVLHQAGSYGKAVILPKIGDLQKLIEEEGYVGGYFEPGDVNGLADAIEKVLVDEEYRKELELTNYYAASSLPMTDIVDWYLIHFDELMSTSRRS